MVVAEARGNFHSRYSLFAAVRPDDSPQAEMKSEAGVLLRSPPFPFVSSFQIILANRLYYIRKGLQ